MQREGAIVCRISQLVGPPQDSAQLLRRGRAAAEFPQTRVGHVLKWHTVPEILIQIFFENNSTKKCVIFDYKQKSENNREFLENSQSEVQAGTKLKPVVTSPWEAHLSARSKRQWLHVTKATSFLLLAYILQNWDRIFPETSQIRVLFYF